MIYSKNLAFFIFYLRLGREPLNTLFSLLSQAWFEESQQQYSNFHGLSVCAVDGVVWSMTYTDENFAHFGSSKGKTAVAPYPQVRATCLVNTNTHEIIDAQIGSMDQGELTLANQLSPPSQSITLFDRAYFSADFLIGWQTRAEASDWLMRAKDNYAMRSLSVIPPMTFISGCQYQQELRSFIQH